MAIWGAMALIVGFALSVLFIGLYLGKVGVYEQGRNSNQEAGGTLVDPFEKFSHRRRIFEILLDAVLVALAYYSAYLLRFDGDLPGEQIAIFIRTLPPLVAIQILSFLIGGVYKGIWRYSGVNELARLAVAVFVGSSVSGSAVWFFYKFHGPSRAVFILNGALLLILRRGQPHLVSYDCGADRRTKDKRHPDARPGVDLRLRGSRRTPWIMELSKNPIYRYRPVGFIDDDTQKTGRLLRGYQIFSSDDLPATDQFGH